MRRITRNERIRDIKPERERGPMVFKLPPRGDTEHDPMFPRLAGGWVSGLGPLPVSPTPATPEPVQELQQYYEQLPAAGRAEERQGVAQLTPGERGRFQGIQRSLRLD
jgi:hypothetical protein